MSDFDEVLERLVADPVFQAALRTNPAAALAGYQLDPGERQLLTTQVDSGLGEERTVEMRISKSGVMGMVGPVVAAFGMAATEPIVSGQAAFGLAPQDEGILDPGTPTQSFGVVTDGQGVFGLADSPGGKGGGGGGGFVPTEAVGYHTSVDVDGDGRWDANTAYTRADGGVDIRVDANRDGVVDFVGHDYDRDGLVDSAEYDTDRDGVMDTQMFDDNKDGWLDRETPIPGPHQDIQTFGQAPASS